MSFFDEVETTVANTRYLQAVQGGGPIRLDLKPFESLQDLTTKLLEGLTVGRLLKLDTLGYYFFKRYLKYQGLDDVVDLLNSVDTYRHSSRHQRTRAGFKLLANELKVTDEKVQASEAQEAALKDGKKQPDAAAAAATAAASAEGDEEKKEGGDDDEAAAAESSDPKIVDSLPADKRVRLFALRMIIAAEDELKTVNKELHRFQELAAAADPGQPQNHPSSALFNEFLGVVAHRLGPLLEAFLASDLFKQLVQHEEYARRPVVLDSFRVFRVLGRGAFGAVSAVQKIDTHAIFAMKEMGKKQIKQNQSEYMCINEKKVLSKMRSPFVLGLTYAFHNEESLFLIFDMCSGGDLKFHLRADKCFDVNRARFYAAEVLLGLAHIHSFNIVYRDLKPNNILLDSSGHVKISDLGLTIKLRKDKVLKHLAGTAGYWAPEIVEKSGTYKESDWWSYGIFLYQMLCGRLPQCICKAKYEWCPFQNKDDKGKGHEKSAQDPENGKLCLKIEYPEEYFNEVTKDLLQKLLTVDHTKRLGFHGAHEIMQHPFFAEVDWDKLEALEVEPPFKPNARTVNANSIGEVGEFNKGKFRKVKLTEDDNKRYSDFTYTSSEGVQKELIDALEKQLSQPATDQTDAQENSSQSCCVVS